MGSICTVPYAIGTAIGTVDDCPQLRLFGMAIILTNVSESILFIVGSFMFLYTISSSLGMSVFDLFYEIVFKYDGFDYILLIGSKLYILCAGFYETHSFCNGKKFDLLFLTQHSHLSMVPRKIIYGCTVKVYMEYTLIKSVYWEILFAIAINVPIKVKI
jgi:hypothetical protein